jgi:hypothetical protein
MENSDYGRLRRIFSDWTVQGSCYYSIVTHASLETMAALTRRLVWLEALLNISPLDLTEGSPRERDIRSMQLREAALQTSVLPAIINSPEEETSLRGIGCRDKPPTSSTCLRRK